VPPTRPASFVSRYLTYALKGTSAPLTYHLAIAYGLLAAVVRRRVWLDHAGGRLYPNVWVCLLGDSGIMCKSTSINLGASVLRRSGEDVLYPDDFSLQRLYRIMAKQPQGTLIHREFRALVDLLKRDYMAGAKAWLTDVYDNPPGKKYETESGGLVEIVDPSLCILSASTLDWFSGKDTQKDIGGGFLARFWFVPASPVECEIRQALPPGHEALEGRRCELGAELTNIAACQGRMRLSTDAEAVYKEWFQWHTYHSPFREGPWAPFLARYEGLVLKLAMLLHLAQGRDNMSPIAGSDMACVTEDVTEYETRLWRCLEGDVAFTVHEAARLKVLKLVPNGKAEVSQRHILKTLRMPLKDLDQVIRTLVAEGEIASRHERVGGETRIWWRRVKGE